MLHWFPYRLALRQPLTLPGAEVMSHRCGVLIHNPETGGWGDAAPLPGYSTESVEQVISVLEQGEAQATSFPSLRFALECASIPFAGPTTDVKVNALWIPSRESLKELWDRLAEWESPLVKIKPGREPDVQLMREFLAARPDAKLRLDGNRQWSIEQLRYVGKSLPRESLDYIEEPLKNSDDYARLDPDVNCPIALDESLLLPEGKALAENPRVTAMVLKPTLLGNQQDRVYWVDLARRRGCQLTWSSAFESGVGLWHLARLAEGGAPAGLDTGNIFVDDVVSPRPLAVAGTIHPTGTLTLNSMAKS